MGIERPPRCDCARTGITTAAEVGRNGTRRDGVHADLALSKFDCQISGKDLNRRLHRRVDAVTRQREPHEPR